MEENYDINRYITPTQKEPINHQDTTRLIELIETITNEMKRK